MHEMSIVMGIIKIAENEATKAGIEKFKAIDLEIGTLAGIEFEALDFAWKVAVEETVLEKAEKRIHKIQAEAICGDCDHLFKIKHIHDSCPKCGSFLKNVIKGKELRVKSLDTY